jgi:two-component system, NarL family, nitrate/nitrite response regulator NarL
VNALVVDDHPLYRAALATLVRSLFGSDAVHEAGTAEFALAVRTTPDLVLLDFRLPALNGAEAVKVFRQRFPSALVIVISASEDRREAQAAMRAGARAFVHKTESMEAIASVIRQVFEGATIEPRWEVGDPQTSLASGLTSRQLEILGMLCEGISNKEIALRLGLAVITVKMHVSAIFRALGVVNRTQAALAARRLGLHEPLADGGKIG